MHTLWSDGSSTVAEMARTAEERGYRFIAITDHTKGLKIANGLNEQRLLEQGNEIDATNAALASRGMDLTILKSAEVNLSPIGQPDIRFLREPARSYSASLGQVDSFLLVGAHLIPFVETCARERSTWIG